MRVVASGGFEDRHVEVTWSDQQPMTGPRDVLLAIIDKGAEMTGKVVGHPEWETISYDYLRKDYGFSRLAAQVIGTLDDPLKMRYPDGEPTIPPISPGAIG